MTPPSTSALRAAGAGVGLLIVMLVYTPAGFGDLGRVWAAAMLVMGSFVAEALVDVRSKVGVWGVVPAGLLAVLLAMYLCVPETDQFVVAAMIPVALLVVSCFAASSSVSSGTPWRLRAWRGQGCSALLVVRVR